MGNETCPLLYIRLLVLDRAQAIGHFSKRLKTPPLSVVTATKYMSDKRPMIVLSWLCY